jgi:hypothetical protein
MTRPPLSSREAQRIDRQAVLRFGLIRSLLAYFDWPRGWWTQPYWPDGQHGKVWNWVHRTLEQR